MMNPPTVEQLKRGRLFMNNSTPHLPPKLPIGTLTFLFTDVEGSTLLWEQYPEQMRQVMARHDELIEGGKTITERPRAEDNDYQPRPLGIAGETVWLIPPLLSPKPSGENYARGAVAV
jgi:hypothetical protein